MASEAEQFQRTFSRRNFVLGVANGALFIFASTLIDPATVLPSYALDLTGAVMGVGLLASVVAAGWAWPPALLAGVMERAPSRLFYYRLFAVFRITAAWLAAWVVLGSRRGEVGALWMLVALLFIMTSSGGGSLLAFMTVVSDSIPPRLRGRFFGMRYFFGGLLSLAGGAYVKHLLSPAARELFPNNYAILFAGAAAVTAVALALFSFCEEFPHTVRRRSLPPLAQLRRGGRLLVRDKDYRNIVVARLLLWLTSGLALPFMVPFAVNELGIEQEAVGIFLSVMVLAYSLSNVLWSYLSDGPGNRILLLISGACYLAVPAMALTAPFIPAQPTVGFLGLQAGPVFWWILAAFALSGLAKAGQMMGHTNYLLELSPEPSRPTYLSFYYATGLPLTFLPIVGAVIIGQEGRYELGFAFSLIISVLMLWVLRGLREVRVNNNGEGHSSSGHK